MSGMEASIPDTASAPSHCGNAALAIPWVASKIQAITHHSAGRRRIRKVLRS